MEILQILKANNIPAGGMADLRSNPVVRQQIQAVVRRAAAQQTQAAPAPFAQPTPAPPAAASPVLTPSEPSIAQRLQELETLRGTGAISDTEYSSKRQQIISEI